MKVLKILSLGTILFTSLMAIEPINKEGGFSGYIFLGASSVGLKSSEIAGSSTIDFKNETIYDHSSPNKNSAISALLLGELKYTLSDKKTEFFIGSSTEELFGFDTSAALGVRHSFDGTGIIGARLLASTTPANVWQDSFLIGSKRVETKRQLRGIGVKWESIFESNFEVDLRSRKVAIENDNNGQSTSLTALQIAQFKREGSLNSAEILYTYKISDGNMLIPSLKYTNDNADGSAENNDKINLKLSHIYAKEKWLFVTTADVGQSYFKERNPLFNKKRDALSCLLGANVTYKKPFDIDKVGIYSGVIFANSNSKIDFYDTNIFVFTLGATYSF